MSHVVRHRILDHPCFGTVLRPGTVPCLVLMRLLSFLSYLVPFLFSNQDKKSRTQMPEVSIFVTDNSTFMRMCYASATYHV